MNRSPEVVFVNALQRSRPGARLMLAFTCSLVLAIIAANVAQAVTVPVPSTANIFGAGHSGPDATPFPGGTSPGPGPSGGTAPPSVSVAGGNILRFAATGIVDFGGGPGPHGPDGYATSAYDFSSYNGIAGYFGDRGGSALFGVFTGVVEPADPAPARLNFVANTSFTTLSPDLNQIFFIGDGLTGNGTGVTQQFTAPAGATTLYLGLADGYPVGPGGSYLVGGYNDNIGSFLVDVASVPEPSTFLLAALGLMGLGIMAWRRRRCWRTGFVARTTPALMAVFVLLGSQTVSASELVINGSFETPVVPPSPPSNKIISVYPGLEPPGFGWNVDSSNVEIVAQGYVGGGGILPFNGPAYHADQWLDLDGYPSPSAISQVLTTAPGTTYSLSFAYGNNPYRSSAATMTVYVQNVGDNVDLITPLPFSHGTATPSDYDWMLSGPIYFTALGASTRLRFVSNDANNFDGDKGILLDNVSVDAVPEPSTFALVVLGLAGLGLVALRRKYRRG